MCFLLFFLPKWSDDILIQSKNNEKDLCIIVLLFFVFWPNEVFFFLYSCNKSLFVCLLVFVGEMMFFLFNCNNFKRHFLGPSPKKWGIYSRHWVFLCVRHKTVWNSRLGTLPLSFSLFVLGSDSRASDKGFQSIYFFSPDHANQGQCKELLMVQKSC